MASVLFQGADVNVMDTDGNTGYDLAVENNHSHLCTLLMQYRVSSSVESKLVFYCNGPSTRLRMIKEFNSLAWLAEVRHSFHRRERNRTWVQEADF